MNPTFSATHYGSLLVPANESFVQLQLGGEGEEGEERRLEQRRGEGRGQRRGEESSVYGVFYRLKSH